MGRLIVISNRLPISITRSDTGFKYKQNSGGLVTGLKALKKDIDFIWIGNISGMHFTDREKQVITSDCWSQFKSIPIFIPKKLNDDSYNGFCNAILWPLLHSLTDNVVWYPAKYNAYKKYNSVFSSNVCDIARDGDLIWIHDYHLMLLPRLIKNQCKKNVKVGFFLHTPFPCPEMFTTLPVAKEILQGMLGSDGIGFHLLEYLSNFIDTCKSHLKLKDFEDQFVCNEKRRCAQEKPAPCTESMDDRKCKDAPQPHSRSNTCMNCIEENSVPQGVQRKGIYYMPNLITIGHRTVRLKAVPIGIDPQLFKDSLSKPETKARISSLKAKFSGKKIILGVDRTDYIKGIPHRLLAFKKYIQKYGNNAVFLQVAVPSRMDVVEYRALVERVKKMVSEINGGCGSVDDMLFYFLNNSVPFDELCALYAASDVCMVTSIRDGMNLVALEYIACQEEGRGRLLLSKFAGASSTLPGCISVNPWNTSQVADSLNECLSMCTHDVHERYAINKRGIDTFTAMRWAEENIRMLSLQECDESVGKAP